MNNQINDVNNVIHSSSMIKIKSESRTGYMAMVKKAFNKEIIEIKK